MNLRKSTFSAGRWTAASTVFVAGVQVAQTAALARLLPPTEFGLMAVASAVVVVLSLIVDLGLSQALIHFDEVPTDQRSSIYWLSMFLSFGLMVMLCAMASVIADLYRSPSLEPLLRWVSLAFPLSAAGQQLRTLASKDLQFHSLAVIEIISAVVACVCAIAAALLGAGVYALAIAALANAGMSSLLAWLTLSRNYFPRLHFHIRDVRPFLKFGGYLVGESIANSFHKNADVIAGGLVVGTDAIGVYSVPRDMNLRLATAINSVVTRVGFPVMSQVKRDQEKLKSIYLQTLCMTASVNFPVFVALGIFASEIVALLYGPQWRGAVIYLKILAGWGLIRSTSNPIGSLLYATGRTQRAFWWNIGLLALLPAMYWLSALDFGLTGLAMAAIVLQLLLIVPSWKLLVEPSCNATLREFAGQFWAPLFCSLAAGAIAQLLVHSISHDSLRLAIGFFSGGVAYIALSLVFNRKWALAMLELAHIAKPNT